MPQLWFMRHAQAGVGIPDRQRELTLNGYQDAVRRGQELRHRGRKVDLLVVSDATRAQLTADAVKQAVDVEEMMVIPALYDDGWAAVDDILESLDHQETVLIIGHEPVVSSKSAWLAATDPQSALVRAGVTTSTVVILEFDSWTTSSGQARILEVLQA